MQFAGLPFAHTGVRSILRLLGIAAVCLTMAAQPKSEDERIRALSGRILAPCCWREAASVHQSPAAETIRNQIASGVAAGRSDDSIIEALVREHGKRILREPEGSQRQWLYWIPVVSAGSAVLLLARFVRRRSASTVPVATASAYAVAQANVDEFLKED